MKRLSIPAAFCVLGLLADAQEAAPKWDVEIPVPIADGTPSQPAPEPEPIDFTVLSSRTTRVEVTEAPEMPGLPPVEGTINITVQKVADPNLPAPPPPLPALPPDDPAVLARLEQMRASYRASTIAFLAATVHDGSRTLLRIYPNGGPNEAVTAWSNLDFNHFSGFSDYRVHGADGQEHRVSLLMGIGNINTAAMTQLAARHGVAYEPPQIPSVPDLAAGGPAFTVVEGQANTAAMEILEQLHDLYRKEGVRMAAACQAREIARAARKAELLANPPKPRDVTIQVWRTGGKPVPTSTGNGQ
ncbi:hypothetical protein [Luteolibacter sp. Populi]|uniref:hypothetical protein n=1 Tax=Luteolibacter sp. Populi TaxID=3230487 RepID=UPI0034662DBB